MSQLILTKQRARSDQDKQIRRRAILHAARALFAETSYAGFAMADVAARTGLVKGTIYLYFRTKEELLLALLGELLWAWLDDLDAALDEARGRMGAARLADVFVHSLRRHEPLRRLLAVLETVVEHNVDASTIRAFKQTLLKRLAATGARLSRWLPHLSAGDGMRVLLHVNALVTGLQQMADPAPTVRAVLEEPALRSLRVDFQRELRAALVTYFNGF